MGRVNCVIRGCSNSTYKAKKWSRQVCEIHRPLKRMECQCEMPVRLYAFPSKLRNSDKREIWVKLTGLKGGDGGVWEPTPSDGICYEHFVDGIPTCDNPNPTLKMGEGLPQRYRRQKNKCKDETRIRHSLEVLAQVAAEVELSKTGIDLVKQKNFLEDHDYINLNMPPDIAGGSCMSCEKWKSLYQELLRKNQALQTTILDLQKKHEIIIQVERE